MGDQKGDELVRQEFSVPRKVFAGAEGKVGDVGDHIVDGRQKQRFNGFV